MAAGRIVLPCMPALDRNGDPVEGALLYFYENNTTTPQAVYSDVGLTTPLSNPVVADSAGQFSSIFADNADLYSVRGFDPDGRQLPSGAWDDVEASVALAYPNTLTISPYMADVIQATDEQEARELLGAAQATAINVRDYGITGVDDKATFATIVALANSTSRNIWVPENTRVALLDGHYDIQKPIVIYGEGTTSILERSINTDNPVLYFNSIAAGSGRSGVRDLRINTTQTTIPGASSFNAAIVFRNITDSFVDNVQVTATGPYGFDQGVVFDGVKRGSCTRFWCWAVHNRGVYIYNDCRDIDVDGVWVDHFAPDGITPRGNYIVNTNAGGTVSTAARININNVFGRGFTSHGIGVSERVSDVIVTNCQMDMTNCPSAYGFLAQFANTFRGRNATFANNRSIGGFYGGVTLNSDDVEWVGNVFRGASTANTYIEDSKRVKITGGSSNSGAAVGVKIVGTVASGCQEIQIVNHSARLNVGNNVSIIGNVGNGVIEVGITGGFYDDGSAKGIDANGNTDHINCWGVQSLRNTTSQITLGGTNSSKFNCIEA